MRMDLRTMRRRCRSFTCRLTRTMTRREKGVHRYNLKQVYGWKNNLGWDGLHWVVFHDCEG